MVELFTNNAHGLLSASLSVSGTSVTLQSGQGTLFPSPGTGDFFRIDIEQASGSTTEIAFCTSRSLDTLTIRRGQEGTASSSFAAGDRVRHSPTAGTFDDLIGTVDTEPTNIQTAWMGPGTGFSSDWGATVTNTGGTQTNSGVTGSNLQNSIPGVINTSTIATQILGFGYGINQGRLWRGNGTNQGGFDQTQIFALPTDLSTAYGFFGLDDDVSATYAPVGTSPGSRTATQQVAVGFNSSSGAGSNWFIFHSDGSGGPVTSVDTGIARNTTDIFKLRLYALPNASTIQVTFTNLYTSVEKQYTVSTNMPPKTSFLTTRFMVSGIIGASVKTFGLWRFNVNQSEPTS